jgi:hypothetical protein
MIGQWPRCYDSNHGSILLQWRDFGRLSIVARGIPRCVKKDSPRKLSQGQKLDRVGKIGGNSSFR